MGWGPAIGLVRTISGCRAGDCWADLGHHTHARNPGGKSRIVEDATVTDDQRPAQSIDFVVLQRLRHDFGADTGHVPYGNTDNRKFAHDSLSITAKRISPICQRRGFRRCPALGRVGVFYSTIADM